MSANEFLTPINQVVQSHEEKPKTTKDPDAIDIVVQFLTAGHKNEMIVYPETTIENLVELLNIAFDEENPFTFINTRNGKQTSLLRTSMANLDMQNNDLLLIDDSGGNG